VNKKSQRASNQRSSQGRENDRPPSHTVATTSLVGESFPSNSLTPQRLSTLLRNRIIGWLIAGVILPLMILGWLGGPVYFTNHFAASAIRRQDYSAAQWWLNCSVSLSSHAPQTHLLLARIARERGDYSQMTEHLQAARMTGRADSLVEREWILADAQRSRLEKIEPTINHWLAQQDPDSPEICDAYVNGLVAASRFETAMRVLDAWIRDYPTDARPHYRRGRIHQHFEQHQPAEASFRSAIALNPNYFSALYSLGKILLDQKQAEEAIDLYERCLQMANPAAAKTALAQALIATGEHERAVTLLEEVVQLSPAVIKASYHSVGQDPETFVAASELGTLLANSGEFDQAYPLLRQSLAVNPRDLNARYSLALTLRGLGQTEAAEAELEIVKQTKEQLEKVNVLRNRINRDPTDTESRIELGQLLISYESQRNGLFWLRSVLSYDPDNQRALQLIAQTEADSVDSRPLGIHPLRESDERVDPAKLP